MAVKVATVTNMLMASIVNNEFRDATLPPQETLARRLKVSRTVLREAISKLESWNVLCVRPKIGTKINPPTKWHVTDTTLVLYRLRAERIDLSVAALNMVVEEIRAALFTAAGFLSGSEEA